MSISFDYRTHGMECLRRGDYLGGYESFMAATRQTPGDWYVWYGAGQCARFLGRIGEARALLARAAALDGRQTTVLLALGITEQLSGSYEEAVDTLVRAIDLDEDFAPAYNSLALTQRKMGELEKALHNYDAGTKALARTFVRALANEAGSRIVPFRMVQGERWLECAVFGAFFHASEVMPASGVSWLSGEQTKRALRSGEYGGLMYFDQPGAEGTTRVFLPNYFCSFQEYLRSGGIFANLIGNQGTCLDLLGRHEEAEAYFEEARDFASPA